MNIESMTPEEKIAAIREACGWGDASRDPLVDLNAAFAFADEIEKRGWYPTITRDNGQWVVSVRGPGQDDYEITRNPSLAVAICDCLLQAQ